MELIFKHHETQLKTTVFNPYFLKLHQIALFLIKSNFTSTMIIQWNFNNLQKTDLDPKKTQIYIKQKLYYKNHINWELITTGMDWKLGYSIRCRIRSHLLTMQLY